MDSTYHNVGYRNAKLPDNKYVSIKGGSSELWPTHGYWTVRVLSLSHVLRNGAVVSQLYNRKDIFQMVLGNSHDLSCEGDMTLVSFIVSFIYKEIAVTKCRTISTDPLYTLFKISKLTLYYIIRVIVPRTLPLIYVCTNSLT